MTTARPGVRTDLSLLLLDRRGNPLQGHSFSWYVVAHPEVSVMRRIASLLVLASLVFSLAAPAQAASAQAARWGASGIGIESCRALAQRTEAAAAV